MRFTSSRANRVRTAERLHDGIPCSVERGLPGFTVSRKLDKMGMRASDTAELAFHDCPVPVENLLGIEGRGFQQLAAGLQRERIMAAVLALSGATQALEDTITYIRERQAFGEPLSKKQALRHKVAEMATESSGAPSLYHARLYNDGRGIPSSHGHLLHRGRQSRGCTFVTPRVHGT